MKKYGLGIGIASLCIAGCMFFLVAMLVPGLWWLFGIPFAVLGIVFILFSDKLNNGKAKRAAEKQVRNEGIKTTKQNLYEQLEREKTARNEMLKNIHGNDKE